MADNKKTSKETIAGFRKLFWAARKEHVRHVQGEHHRRALDYEREHSLGWAETVLQASLLIYGACNAV